MSQKLENESRSRKESEIQCIASEEALATATDKIQSLEQRLEEMDDTALRQTNAIMDMESKHRALEMQLEESKEQLRKSELKYEKSLNEIKSCQELAQELKIIIAEKVR